MPQDFAFQRVFWAVFPCFFGRSSPLSWLLFRRFNLSGKIEQKCVAHSVPHAHGDLCHKSVVMPDEPRATDFGALCSIFSVSASLGLCQRLAAPVTGCGAVCSRYNVEWGRFAAWAAPPLRRSDHGCKHHQRDVQRFTGGNRNHRPFAGEEGMTTANRNFGHKESRETLGSYPALE